MPDRNWKQAHGKVHDADTKKRNSGRNENTINEMKSAISDEKRLKRKRKRLSIDWFFRPDGD